MVPLSSSRRTSGGVSASRRGAQSSNAGHRGQRRDHADLLTDVGGDAACTAFSSRSCMCEVVPHLVERLAHLLDRLPVALHQAEERDVVERSCRPSSRARRPTP